MRRICGVQNGREELDTGGYTCETAKESDRRAKSLGVLTRTAREVIA